MKLYIKQKVFSLKQKFSIQDETGADKYFAESKLISIGRQLTITDAAGNEVAFVKQKVLTLLPRFFVYVNGQEVASIAKKFTLLKPKYEVEGVDWKINGSFLEHDYTIDASDMTIAAIHKKWMSWGDSYELDINDNADEVMALAVILAIDTVMDNQSQ